MSGRPFVEVRWYFGSDFLDLQSSCSDRLSWLTSANVRSGQPCVCAFCSWHEIGQLACGSGKIKPKYHQTLICGRLFVCMALSSVFPLSFWCRLWDIGLNIFNINILWGLIFQEFHDFWLVNVFLVDTIIVLKILNLKNLKLTKTSFEVSDGRFSGSRSGYRRINTDCCDTVYYWRYCEHLWIIVKINGSQRTIMDYYEHLWIKCTSRSTVTYQCTLTTKAARRQRDDCLKVRGLVWWQAVVSLLSGSCWPAIRQ
jgi:hypothetical protein